MGYKFATYIRGPVDQPIVLQSNEVELILAW